MLWGLPCYRVVECLILVNSRGQREAIAMPSTYFVVLVYYSRSWGAGHTTDYTEVKCGGTTSQQPDTLLRYMYRQRSTLQHWPARIVAAICRESRCIVTTRGRTCVPLCHHTYTGLAGTENIGRGTTGPWKEHVATFGTLCGSSLRPPQ